MIDLKRPADKSDGSVPVPSLNEKAHYPYGLRLHLEKEELARLGPQVADLTKGDIVKLVCEAEVTGLAVNEDEYGESASLSIQIKKMTVSASGTSKTTVRKALDTLRGKKAP